MVRLDHDPDRHDDRAVALALAATTLLEQPNLTPTHAWASRAVGDDVLRELGGELLVGFGYDAVL